MPSSATSASTDPGGSSVDEAEERVTEARDEVLGTENQTPPGTS